MEDFRIRKILGQRIAQARKDKNLSQAALGAILNKKGDVIGKYERGNMSPSIEVVFQIAEALEVSIDYLTDKISTELDDDMLKRLEKISQMPTEDKNVVYRVVDALIMQHDIRNNLKS